MTKLTPALLSNKSLILLADVKYSYVREVGPSLLACFAVPILSARRSHRNNNIGSINLIFGLVSLNAGGSAVMPIIASVIAIVTGLLTLKGPMCIFEDKRTLIIPALLGAAKRVYEFESLNQLSMRGGLLRNIGHQNRIKAVVRRQWTLKKFDKNL